MATLVFLLASLISLTNFHTVLGAWDSSCASATAIRYSSPHQYPKFSIRGNFTDPSCTPGGRCSLVFDLTSSYYRMPIPAISTVTFFVDDSNGSNIGEFSIPALQVNEGLEAVCGGKVVKEKDNQAGMKAPFLTYWNAPEGNNVGDWLIRGGVVFDDGVEQVLKPVPVEFEHYKESSEMTQENTNKDQTSSQKQPSEQGHSEGQQEQQQEGEQEHETPAGTSSNATESPEENLVFSAADKPARPTETSDISSNNPPTEDEENLVFTAHGGTQGDVTLPSLDPEAFRDSPEEIEEGLPMVLLIILSIGVPGIAAIAMLVGRNIMSR